MMATSLHQGTVIRVVDSAGEPIRKKGSIDFFAMGGDINCTNDLLQTPLHIAISVGNNMVVKQLLDKRSEINLSVSEKCSIPTSEVDRGGARGAMAPPIIVPLPGNPEQVTNTLQKFSKNLKFGDYHLPHHCSFFSTKYLVVSITSTT